MASRASRSTPGLQFLLRITSPTMPLGGFSYSGGLESAVEKGLVENEDDAAQWIEDGLCGVLSVCEGPLWLLLYQAIKERDAAQATQWNHWYWASRDTREMRQETQQMGWSLRQVAMNQSWGNPDLQGLRDQLVPETYLAMHAYASVVHGVKAQDGLLAFFYAWADNQTLAAIKTVPLGQSAGQRLLAKTGDWIEKAVAKSQECIAQQPPTVQTSAVQLSILSSQHEHQYSRLFRS
ncbi:MAG: urease accessory protein UreF [Betaproteobacteria bacterium]|nr:urease accessory protein UreF [Betaproteobacteria bacterium]